MSAARHRSARIVALLAALATALLLTGAPLSAQDTTEPSDELWGVQWGPQQVRAHHAWSDSTGDGITIAVVDTGVDYGHEDLGKFVTGNTFIEGCRDGEENEDCERDGSWDDGEDDGHPHGTHVAGIAAAVTDNGTGIAAVAPDAQLMSVKVLDSSGRGTFRDVADGIVWATDNGAEVINLSLGGLQGYQVLAEAGLLEDVVEAVRYANEQGVVVVAAAGNDAVPLCNEPAFREGVVCVGATDERELPSWYSTWPNKADRIAVSAPGGSGTFVICYEGIVSTVPADEGIAFCGYPENETYDEYDGTSMATPHVAGAAALVRELGCDREATIDTITSTARTPGLETRGTWTPRYGYGIVDAEAAVGAGAQTCDGAGGGGDHEGGRPDDPGDGRRPADPGPPDDRDRPHDDDRPSGEAGRAAPDRALLTAYLGSLHLGR